GVVAMAEREIGHAALADLAAIADDAGLAIGLQRSVRRIQIADSRPDAARAVIRGQQDPRRAGILQLDEVRLVLDDERCAEPACQRGTRVPHLDADLTDRRMGQEATAEDGVMLGLDGAPVPAAFHPLGAAAAGAMQAEPMAAR